MSNTNWMNELNPEEQGLKYNNLWHEINGSGVVCIKKTGRAKIKELRKNGEHQTVLRLNSNLVEKLDQHYGSRTQIIEILLMYALDQLKNNNKDLLID